MNINERDKQSSKGHETNDGTDSFHHLISIDNEVCWAFVIHG